MLRLSIPKRIKLNFEVCKEKSLVSCDQIQIHQVLMNMCLNSRDAIADEGFISISLSNVDVPFGTKAFIGEARPGKYACLTIADSGVGISAQDLERIFEPFRGSVFSIYFPVYEDEVVQVKDFSLRASRLDAPHIMIVDDERDIRTYLSDLLTVQGFDVIAGANDDEAVAEIVNANKPVDLVVTDVNLPGMSAAELIRYLSQFQKSIRFIVISGHEIEPAAFNKIGPNIAGFLQKPFRAKQYLARLKGP